jgi:hypothetical protein
MRKSWRPRIACSAVLGRLGAPPGELLLDSGRNRTTGAMLLMLEVPLDALGEDSSFRQRVRPVPVGIEFHWRHARSGAGERPNGPKLRGAGPVRYTLQQSRKHARPRIR